VVANAKRHLRSPALSGSEDFWPFMALVFPKQVGTR